MWKIQGYCLMSKVTPISQLFGLACGFFILRMAELSQSVAEVALNLMIFGFGALKIIVIFPVALC